MGESKKEVNLVQLATRLPSDLHKKIKVHCAKEGVSVMAFVTKAIERALAQASK